MSLKRTQGTLRAVREERTFLKQFSLVTEDEQVETVFVRRNPRRTDRQGEVWEGLSGSKSMARKEREDRKLGGPKLTRHSNCEIQPGQAPQRQGEDLMGERESDRLIRAGKGQKAQNQQRGRRGDVTSRGNRSGRNG
ncbi:MAG: hypothetical protein K9N48_08710 [Verrucomicrobia bacterium]|nr:hypothetical protein [Verrucomicrobiota bacterium]